MRSSGACLPHFRQQNVKIPDDTCQQAHVSITVTTTPYSNEPLLVHVRCCLRLLCCVYKHL
jgi:hypothetical protein